MKVSMLFLILLAINIQRFQSLKFKIFKCKNVSFPDQYLITKYYANEKIICLNYCDLNFLCSTVSYKENKECKLFNRLAYDDDLTSSYESDVYVKYPRSCKQIKRFNPQAINGLYYIETPNGKIEVFCEFEFDNEGFTFLPRESLDVADDNFLKDFYLNQSVFLTKYLVLNKTNQPYILIQQLDKYSNQPIVITINQGTKRYPSISTNFFKISLVNESNSPQTHSLSGFKGNGKNFSYNACDNATYRYFVFYQTLLEFNKNLKCDHMYSFQKFISYGKYSTENSNVPSSFFYTTEILMAGCEIGILSNCNHTIGAYAFAFGLK